MQELMGVHAEAPFAIGTVGEAPQPVIVSNRMRNVAQRHRRRHVAA